MQAGQRTGVLKTRDKRVLGWSIEHGRRSFEFNAEDALTPLSQEVCTFPRVLRRRYREVAVSCRAEMDRVRVNKWLWAARFFETRSAASEAVLGGRVHVNGARVKPAKELAVGDTLELDAAFRRTNGAGDRAQG